MRQTTWACPLTMMAAALVCVQGGLCQTSPYSGLEGREIKALSPEKIEAYRAGQGMGLAMAAELNGYPGPKHVLELEDALDLTAAQEQSTRQVYEEMLASARALGDRIVTLERELDELFASREITREALSRQIAAIAELQGELRMAHLEAHLKMMEILTEKQISEYTALRGYHEAQPSGRSHPGEHDHDR